MSQVAKSCESGANKAKDVPISKLKDSLLFMEDNDVGSWARCMQDEPTVFGERNTSAFFGLVEVFNVPNCASIDDLFFHFGGNKTVADLAKLGDSRWLIELRDQPALDNALALNGKQLYACALKIEAIEKKQVPRLTSEIYASHIKPQIPDSESPVSEPADESAPEATAPSTTAAACASVNSSDSEKKTPDTKGSSTQPSDYSCAASTSLPPTPATKSSLEQPGPSPVEQDNQGQYATEMIAPQQMPMSYPHPPPPPGQQMYYPPNPQMLYCETNPMELAPNYCMAPPENFAWQNAPAPTGPNQHQVQSTMYAQYPMPMQQYRSGPDQSFMAMQAYPDPMYAAYSQNVYYLQQPMQYAINQQMAKQGCTSAMNPNFMHHPGVAPLPYAPNFRNMDKQHQHFDRSQGHSSIRNSHPNQRKDNAPKKNDKYEMPRADAYNHSDKRSQRTDVQSSPAETPRADSTATSGTFDKSGRTTRVDNSQKTTTLETDKVTEESKSESVQASPPPQGNASSSTNSEEASSSPTEDSESTVTPSSP